MVKDLDEKMELDYAQIYIVIKNGVLTVEVDGGDGGSSLSDDQLRKLKEILNSVEI